MSVNRKSRIESVGYEGQNLSTTLRSGELALRGTALKHSNKRAMDCVIQ